LAEPPESRLRARLSRSFFLDLRACVGEKRFDLAMVVRDAGGHFESDLLHYLPKDEFRRFVFIDV
jgi:hypothetical protein